MGSREATRAAVVEELRVMEPATTAAIAAGIGITQATTIRALRSLEKSGVVRRVSPGESLAARGRATVYELTETEVV